MLVEIEERILIVQSRPIIDRKVSEHSSEYLKINFTTVTKLIMTLKKPSHNISATGQIMSDKRSPVHIV